MFNWEQIFVGPAMFAGPCMHIIHFRFQDNYAALLFRGVGNEGEKMRNWKGNYKKMGKHRQVREILYRLKNNLQTLVTFT
jgi:hypothetical protein